MDMKKRIREAVPAIIDGLGRCASCMVAFAARRQGMRLADRQAVHRVLDALICLLFPGCHGRNELMGARMQARLNRTFETVALTLTRQAARMFQYYCRFDKCRHCGDCTGKAEKAVLRLISSLPEIQQALQQDIVAAYEGDPAAKSTMEVVMSYPGIEAIITHRIAHVLYECGVPLIPRIMAERAHSWTGIDIHPGAKIGPAFFIDHGTGVVIGETCVIGKNVKLYQGVTLGALSFPKDEHGKLVKGIKRHPNVGDDVIIYAGATILGGDTTIGKKSVIGGNVWLTHSVPPYSKVYNRQPNPLIIKARR